MLEWCKIIIGDGNEVLSCRNKRNRDERFSADT